MAIEPHPPSQGKRRAVYGLNVAVAVIAALALVVLINGLVDWQVRRLPAGAKSLLRYDLTATRAHTLAPQTQQLLGDLGADLRLVAVLRVDDKNGQDVADLLEEYTRASVRLSREVIHPDRDLGRLENFYRELEDRLADETAPLRSAVGEGLSAVSGLTDDVAAMKQRVAELTTDDGLADGPLRDELQLLVNKLGQIETAYREAGDTLAEAVAKPLPPWSNARNDLLNALRKADAEVLGPFAREFSKRARDREAPLGVRDALLRMDGTINAMRQRVDEAVKTLTAPPTPTRYDRLLGSLRSGEVVVILGDEAERVVPVEQMFSPGPADDAGQATSQFIGEDRLTGTLVTMQMELPPLIVFVHDGPVSPVLPRGGLSHVGGRLMTANFEVAEWRIGGGEPGGGGAGGGAGGESAEGQALAAPPPTPAAGQRAVWVVPSLSLVRTTQADRELVAGVLSKRLVAGDGVLLSFSYDAEALYRAADPLIELAGAWGIVPRMHELVLRENLGADGRPRGEAGWLVEDWPSDSPMGGALAGRQVQLVAPTPIALEPRPNVQTMPLIELNDPRAWVATGLTTPAEIAAEVFKSQDALNGAVVAAAAEWVPETPLQQAKSDGTGRLIVFTERHWLSDQQAGRRLGNSELFMNCTYWLAGLNRAIAATPRSRDIRRVEALTAGQQLRYRLILLAGLPGLALVLGVAVWLVRRRG